MKAWSISQEKMPSMQVKEESIVSFRWRERAGGVSKSLLPARNTATQMDINGVAF